MVALEECPSEDEVLEAQLALMGVGLVMINGWWRVVDIHNEPPSKVTPFYAFTLPRRFTGSDRDFLWRSALMKTDAVNSAYEHAIRLLNEPVYAAFFTVGGWARNAIVRHYV